MRKNVLGILAAAGALSIIAQGTSATTLTAGQIWDMVTETSHTHEIQNFPTPDEEARRPQLQGRILDGLEEGNIVTRLQWHFEERTWTGDWSCRTCGSDTPAPASVPEPATMVLLGAGLLGVAAVSRRKIR